MHILGIRISLEWAKSNLDRKIHSPNIAVWGQSLSTSAERGEQLNFIEKVEKDVDDLLSGELDHQQISNERYYKIEDYDNF
jgi:hypothetical protein